jgi:hypothetical protein
MSVTPSMLLAIPASAGDFASFRAALAAASGVNRAFDDDAGAETFGDVGDLTDGGFRRAAQARRISSGWLWLDTRGFS